MTRGEKILGYLQSIEPERATISQIESQADVHPHQQVYQITQKLLRAGVICGAMASGIWEFWARSGDDARLDTLDRSAAVATSSEERSASEALRAKAGRLTAREFEALARRIMAAEMGVHLTPRTLPGVPKRFDLVSADGTIVGDAKYYAMVQGKARPPAKFATIAEHVWLLEKANAKFKFLVFGNDRRVPATWLGLYGALVDEVVFYYLSDDGALCLLNSPSGSACGRCDHVGA